jgi:hypothetical protein
MTAAMVVAGCQSPSASDRTELLQTKLEALHPGEALTLDPEIYPHSEVLRVRVPNVTIDGNETILNAVNDETSAVEVFADGVAVTNLTLTSPTADKRWFNDQQHKLVVRGKRDTISQVITRQCLALKCDYAPTPGSSNAGSLCGKSSAIGRTHSPKHSAPSSTDVPGPIGRRPTARCFHRCDATSFVCR